MGLDNFRVIPKKYNIFIYVCCFIFFIFFGSQTVNAYLETQYSDYSLTGTNTNNHIQYMGKTTTGDTSEFSSITFYVTNATQIPTGYGSTGLRFYCYTNADRTGVQDCGTITPLSAQITNLSTLQVYSSFPSGYLASSASVAYKVKFFRSTPVNIPSNYYTYFGFKGVDSSHTLSMMGSNFGSGAYVITPWGATFPESAVSDSISSWAFCLNSDSNCGNAVTPTFSGIGTTEPSTGLTNVRLSGSGNFIYGESGSKARIDIFRYCTSGTGSSEYKLQSHVLATVEYTYGLQGTQTIQVSPYRYIGTGYNTSTTYGFTNVVVEYIAGLNCTYPYTTTVYYPDGTIQYQDLNISGSAVIVPEISTNNVLLSPSAPALTDPISWILYQIKTFFTNLFSPDFYAYTEQFGGFTQTKALLETKAPFGYFTHIIALSTSAPATSENVATLSMNIASGMPLSSVVWIPSIDFGTLLGPVRTAITVFLWLGFIGGVIYLAKDLLSKL